MNDPEDNPFARAGVILTRSGLPFDLLDPDPDRVRIGDVAHALSNLCRFCGHARAFYSVAQHSVLVSRLVPEEDARAGLLHDAAEAYISDLVRPLKDLLPEFRKIEKGVESAVFRAFGLPPSLPETVKAADLVALALEKRHLMPESAPWPILGEIPDWALSGAGRIDKASALRPRTPEEAKRAFLTRYEELSAPVRPPGSRALTA